MRAITRRSVQNDCCHLSKAPARFIIFLPTPRPNRFFRPDSLQKRARNIYATRLPITKWRIKEITANTSNRWISPPATWNTVKPPSQAISSTTNKLSIYSWSFLLLVRKHCQIPGRTVCLTGCRSSEHQATSRRGTFRHRSLRQSRKYPLPQCVQVSPSLSSSGRNCPSERKAESRHLSHGPHSAWPHIPVCPCRSEHLSARLLHLQLRPPRVPP